MRSGTLTKVAVVCAAGVVTLASCGSGQDGAGQDGDISVVTGVYPLEWLATQIGGDHVDVTELTDPGDEPHNLELNPKQIGQISEADLAFYIGGLQPAVDDAVHQEADDHALDVGNLVKLRAASDNDGHNHDEEGHDHGTKDPHMWLDPQRMSSAAEGLGNRLAKVDPEHAKDYEAGAKRVTKKLDKIDSQYSKELQTCQSRDLVTNHAAFGYLAARYDLKQIGISGLSPDSEPSPARMADISNLVREDDITTVFTETLASKAIAKTISKETGAKTEVLDPLEGITKQSPGDDYPSVMRANLRTLTDALRCD